MAAEFYALVTDLGTREMLKAVSEEKKVNITGFAVGDGAGQYYRPEAGMQRLRNEVWRGEVNSCRISEESENVMIIESVIPSDAGGFTIREMGVFSSDGTMIAVCNTPDTQKVRVSDGVVHELSLIMEIALSNTDAVELVVDQSVVTATKKDLQILKAAVEINIKDLELKLEKISDYSIENRGLIHNMQNTAADLNVRLTLLELMYAAEISKNPFTVTFDSLDGLSASGVWNVPMKRIEF